MITIRVQTQDFNLQDEYNRLCGHGVGAVVTFTGLVREFNSSDDKTSVQALYLQHYPGMTEKLLEDIAREAAQRWAVLDITVIHRVGELLPQEQIVLVAVSSAHREAAFDAARFLMDYLKTRATFWKKTVSATGEQWLDMKDSDRAAARRWQQDDSAESGADSK